VGAGDDAAGVAVEIDAVEHHAEPQFVDQRGVFDAFQMLRRQADRIERGRVMSMPSGLLKISTEAKVP